ncbi:MAG TPA: SDR family oxidoreductase [Micropepsaceae bacterium]|nr:SDR family oxidoreductase [Micropepsaceae bacterium]
MIAIDFSGQTVLVTGGTSGIGNGIARAFLRAGAAVHVTGTRPAAGYAAEDGSDLSGLAFHQLDIADDEAVAAFAAKFGALDVLVNSVGTVAYKRKEFEMETFRRIMDVNLNGVMHISTLFHDRLAAARGSIIQIASLASFFSTRNNPAYSASKGGLAILTKTLADNWGRDGIRVNAIAPGFVASKLTRVSRDNPKIYEASIRRTPLGRWGTPDDMGNAALFLASPLASFITGQTICVDGGISLST